MTYNIPIPEPTTDTAQGKNIRDILYRRSDLSTFVVHLTKDKSSLDSIINSWEIEARSVWGLAKSKISESSPEWESQKCVCFTETPLEHLHHMIEPIKGRSYQPGPYGIAITKKIARINGINPILYIDRTPAQTKQWELFTAFDNIANKKIEENDFLNSDISKITPFIEQMKSGINRGTDEPYRKEFWWEREWRHVGNFKLPEHIIIICPEDEFTIFEELVKDKTWKPKCIDPNWGLEKIIAHLAGFDNKEIDIL